MVLYKGDNVEVRTYEYSDNDEIIRLYINSYFGCFGPLDIFKPSLYEEIENIQDVETKKLNKEIFVITKDNIILGYAYSYIDKDKVIIGHTTVLNNPEIAEIMINVLKQIADNEEKDIVALCNYTENAYVKSGFNKSGDLYRYTHKKLNYLLPKMFNTEDKRKTLKKY